MTNPTGNIFEQMFFGLKAEVEKLGTEALAEAKNLASAAVGDFEALVAQGLPIAVEAVLGQAPLAISGREKFGTAVGSVVQQLEAKLGPVAVEDGQALVQMAFRALPLIAAAL